MQVAGRCFGTGVGIYDVQYPFQFCHSFCSCLCPDLHSTPWENWREIKPAPFLPPSCERAEVRTKIREGSLWLERRLAARLTGSCPCWLAQFPQPARYLPARDAGTRPRALLAPPSCRLASQDRFRGHSASSDHRVPLKERVYSCVPARSNHRDVIRCFLEVGTGVKLASRGSCTCRIPCLGQVSTAHL